MVRKIDNAGRLLIPKDIRDKLRWEEGELIHIELTDNGVLLKKNDTYCPLCGIEPISIKIGDRGICEKCYERIMRFNKTSL